MPAPKSRQGMILIVDDEPTSLRFLTDALEGADFTVLVATSGQSALDRVSRVTPDLILMDAMMPELDGFATTALIKANPAVAHVPVIFMTGLTDSEHVVEAFRVGGADYVRKPVALDELLARIRAHVANGRMVHASLAGLEAAGRLMMAMDIDGRFLWCTPLAEAAIQRIAPGWSKDAATLPVEFNSVLPRLLSLRGLPGTCVKVTHEQCTLELAILAQYRENEVLIRFNEVNPAADVTKLLRYFNLTPREAEVLLWVSYGKPNRVIGDILKISPRTVHKHLERIFDKLGIETRAAATAIAIRSIGQ